MEQGGSGVAAAISLPKGGGAIKGIGETFQHLFTGTGNFSVPIPTSPGARDSALRWRFSTAPATETGASDSDSEKSPTTCRAALTVKISSKTRCVTIS